MVFIAMIFALELIPEKVKKKARSFERK